jgi:hypothetical protein
MYRYKVTLRCDWEDYFCTEDAEVMADSLLDAATIADQTMTNCRTVWAIERVD